MLKTALLTRAVYHRRARWIRACRSALSSGSPPGPYTCCCASLRKCRAVGCSPSVPPEVFEPRRAQCGVARRVGDGDMAPGVDPIVGQFVAAGVPQHVEMYRERQALKPK